MYTVTASYSSKPGAASVAAGAYQQIGVQTGVAAATPHRLIEMLFDGYLDAVAQARGALRAGQIEAKGRAIARACRIVEEGLKAGLDTQSGGQLAADLHDLYSYVARRLIEANLHNDEAALDECRNLIAPLRDAWVEIGDRT